MVRIMIKNAMIGKKVLFQGAILTIVGVLLYTGVALLEQDVESFGKSDQTATVQEVMMGLRWKRYRQVYHYLSPDPRSLNDDTNQSICGASPDFETYFAQNKKWRSANDEDQRVYQLFPDRFRSLAANGHYVELGAFDGVRESNTRFFDQCLGWTGLLIEGNPTTYGLLTSNRKHAHRMSFAPSCSLEDEQQNKTLPFHALPFANAGLEGSAKAYPPGHTIVNVPCGSLTPVIQDVMEGRIHFFSLDVEGSEPSVLENIDFLKVQIDVLMVESWNNICPREPRECETRARARHILKEAGYKRYANLVEKSDLYIHPQSEFQLSQKPDGRRHRHL